MVWAARGSGNHSRPFTPAQACLGAGATPAAGCLEGRRCVPASPARRPRLAVQATGGYLLAVSR